MSGYTAKVYLVSYNETEIHKFRFPSRLVYRLNDLKKEFRTMFPQLEDRPFKVQWNDDPEGKVDKLITIGNDEELEIAIEEMRDFKCIIFYVKPVVTEETSQQAKTTSTHSKHLPLHVNVICDNCNQHIAGFRYKCIHCDNFDLCSTCEAQGNHAEHWFLRIPKPLEASLKFRAFQRVLQRVPLNLVAHSSRSLSPKKSVGRCYNVKRHCSHSEKRGKRHRCKSDTSDKNDAKSDCEEQRSHTKMGARSSSKNKCKPTEDSNDEDDSSGLNGSPDALPVVFETTLRMVDRMTNEMYDEMTKSSDQTPQSKEGPKSPTDEKANPVANDGCMSDTEQHMHDANNEQCEDDDKTKHNKKSKTGEEWILVDKTEAMRPRGRSISPAREALPTEVENTTPLASISTAANIYPELPESEKIFHCDPTIQEAVKTMIAMGYSNKGGVLSHLLELCHGSIGKVIDLLELANG